MQIARPTSGRNGCIVTLVPNPGTKKLDAAQYHFSAKVRGLDRAKARDEVAATGPHFALDCSTSNGHRKALKVASNRLVQGGEPIFLGTSYGSSPMS